MFYVDSCAGAAADSGCIGHMKGSSNGGCLSRARGAGMIARCPAAVLGVLGFTRICANRSRFALGVPRHRLAEQNVARRHKAARSSDSGACISSSDFGDITPALRVNLIVGRLEIRSHPHFTGPI